uniref:Uncharacterized protein n=1 Tax=Arundo donax TaxID=35708 RepID=A0A0A9EMW9_ARUDO
MELSSSPIVDFSFSASAFSWSSAFRTESFSSWRLEHFAPSSSQRPVSSAKEQ